MWSLNRTIMNANGTGCVIVCWLPDSWTGFEDEGYRRKVHGRIVGPHCCDRS
jgi:hypothetical protein